MSFGVSDGRRLRVQRRPRRTGCSRSARTSSRPGFTAWSPTSCASTATRARCWHSAARAHRSGTGSTRAATRAPFVERLIVPQASAVWSADPRQMWTFPARFLVEFFDNHGMLGFAKRPQWRTIPGGSRALRGRVITADRCPAPARHPGPRRSRATRTASRDAGDGRSASTRSSSPTHSDQALTDARRRDRPRARAPAARSRTSPTRRSCTRDPRLLPRRRGAWASWNYHLLAGADRDATVTYHMNRLQALTRRPRVLRDAQPRGGDRSRRRCCARISYAHPVFTARRRARAGAPRRDQRPPPHALRRRLLALGVPRGRRRQRRARRRALRGDACETSTPGRSATGASRCASTSSGTGSRWPTPTSTHGPARVLSRRRGGRGRSAGAGRDAGS